ncbi:MAG: hypothetical protein ACFE9A_17840 [Candidatus Hodarchaeota archaeon]
MGQNIEGRNTKNGTERNIEEIQGNNDHSANPTTVLILEETLTTEKEDKGNYYFTTNKP